MRYHLQSQPFSNDQARKKQNFYEKWFRVPCAKRIESDHTGLISIDILAPKKQNVNVGKTRTE